MKCVGLIGGMSWQSTVFYYNLMNQCVAKALGGLHSAEIRLTSVDLAPVKGWIDSEDWASATKLMIEAANGLISCGAECVLICSNTMHKCVPDVERAISVPVLSAIAATGNALSIGSLRRPALFATNYTVRHRLFCEYLESLYGMQTILPTQRDQNWIQETIYKELCYGQRRTSSVDRFQQTISMLVDQGADSVILGCTELAMLVEHSTATVPVLDTAALHAQAAVEFALEGHIVSNHQFQTTFERPKYDTISEN